jgi:hypothetical protein
MIKQTIILLMFSTLLLYSQNRNNDSLSSFEFKWSNDFEYETDYYYTNGFSFELVTPWIANNPVNSMLLPHSANSLVIYSLTLLQDIYTPKVKFYIPDQLDGDRPFAAYILLGTKKLSFQKRTKIKLYSEFQVGILGPAALGEEVQNGIHSLLPTSSEVLGWENQISNSIMINYSASLEKYFTLTNWFEVSGIASAKLGLPFTTAGVGLKTRIGFFDILPNEFEFLSDKKWNAFITLSTFGKIVGYNATLQGGLFSESIYTLSELNRFVGFASIGITGIYKHFKMEYTQHFNTPEFPNAEYHSWGYLLLKFRF